MRRRILYSNQNENTVPDSSKANVLDVVFANKNDGKLIIVTGGESSWKSFPSSTWEPIGIVVIPGEHDVLKDEDGNNQCGIISLVSMNCDTPNNGGPTQNGGEAIMRWGNDVFVTLDAYPGIVTCANTIEGNRVATGGYFGAMMPIQKSIGEIPIWDIESYQYAPSPYAGDDLKSGELNTVYSVANTTYGKNCLSDFDGMGNTKKIVKIRGEKDYKGWKPIYNNYMDYPAASCCDMFSTLGTEQGDWYLPACGELGYIPPRFADINGTINAIKNAYGIEAQLLGNNTTYWSSTEETFESARSITTNNGNVSSGDKKNYDWWLLSARAFMRL